MPTDKLEDFILQNRDTFDDAPVPASLWSRIESDLETPDDDNDPLETFISANRDAFDETTPPLRLEGRVFAAMDEAAKPAASPLRVFSRRK